LQRPRASQTECRTFSRKPEGHVGCVVTGMFDQPPSLQDPRTFAIIGAAYEVHRVLGTGYLEILYKDALEIEFTERQIPFERERPCCVEYKGRPLSKDYHADFVCFGEVVLEIKARSVTGPADHAQVLNYLASMKIRIGLLLNFGTAKLEHRRFIWEPRT
jgi:GxxExxY protein